MTAFIRAALVRAVRTAAQTALATIGAAAALDQIDWRVVASASGLAALLAVLTAVATGLPEAAEPVPVAVVEPIEVEDAPPARKPRPLKAKRGE